MSELLHYHYAEIDPETGLCVGVFTTSKLMDVSQLPDFVEIPVYDEEYVDKYYINGSWWEDAAGTIPWESSLL